MGLTLITPPSGEPVSLEEARLHLRIDSDDEDPLVAALIRAARDYVERQTGRALITQTWQFTQDRFPWYGEVIRLGRAPVQSVTFVKYLNSSGVLTTLASTEYIADITTYGAGEIVLGYQKTWPTIQDQRNAITVEFIAGYGSNATSVPPSLKAAILLVLGDLYANREAQVAGMTINENPTVERLLNPYRYQLVA